MVPEQSEGALDDKSLSRDATLSEMINALPERLRRYVHDLETRCDPSGDIQTIASLTEQRHGLLQQVAELQREIDTLKAASAPLLTVLDRLASGHQPILALTAEEMLPIFPAPDPLNEADVCLDVDRGTCILPMPLSGGVGGGEVAPLRLYSCTHGAPDVAVDPLHAQLAEVEAERDEARADAAQIRGGAAGSIHKLRARLAEVEAERDAAIQRCDVLQGERDRLFTAGVRVAAERDAATALSDSREGR